MLVSLRPEGLVPVDLVFGRLGSGVSVSLCSEGLVPVDLVLTRLLAWCRACPWSRPLWLSGDVLAMGVAGVLPVALILLVTPFPNHYFIV